MVQIDDHSGGLIRNRDKEETMPVRLVLAALAVLGGSFTAVAQDKYPSRPIEIIIPYAPGGGSDIMIRNMVKVIEQHKLVPVPLAVVNRPGGGGAIARTQFSRARPDGYTLGVMDPNPVLQQLLGEAQQDYRKDFTYIAKLVDDVNFFIVRSDSPIKTLADAVAEARKRGPKRFTIAGTATGSQDHVASLDYDAAIKMETNYLITKSGNEVLTTLLGGHVDAAWANPSECIEQYKAGQVRILAVADTKRIADFPDVPTFKEAGVDMVSYNWRGIGGPPKLPKDVVDYWIDALTKMRATDDWKKGYLAKVYQEDGWLTGDQLMAYVNKEHDQFRAVFQKLGLLKN
jgi:putative tricarboxylic transport membrane protein